LAQYNSPADPCEAVTTIGLKILVWSAALAFAQMLLSLTGVILQVGLPVLAGNREKAIEYTGWVTFRAGHLITCSKTWLCSRRFLVAQIAGRNPPVTAYGAEIFFFARLVYAGAA
jgi:hypothetical protein